MSFRPTSSVVQLVDADGGFNAPELSTFSTAVGLPSAGQGYQVVAVMGPQSSGKSTLLNALVRREAETAERGARMKEAPCTRLDVPSVYAWPGTVLSAGRGVPRPLARVFVCARSSLVRNGRPPSFSILPLPHHFSPPPPPPHTVRHDL